MDTLLSIPSDRLDMPLLESGGWHDIVNAIPSVERITPAFHVTFVARQEATWLIEGSEEIFLQSGQLGLVQPEHRHQGAWAVDHPNQHFWFYFNPKALDAERHTPFSREWLAAQDARLRCQGHRVVQAPPELAGLCEAIPACLKRGAERDILWLRSLIAQIFLLSVEALTAEQADAMPDILRAVDAKLLDWPQVSAVAAYFAMDPSQFQRLFKKATGMSPWNYIIRARCRVGCDQLRSSERSITTIAHELGFSSSQHFSTVFRRLTGHSPGEFRRLHGRHPSCTGA